MKPTKQRKAEQICTTAGRSGKFESVAEVAERLWRQVARNELIERLLFSRFKLTLLGK